MNWIISKIKAFGVRAAVQALDNLEVPLGQKIDSSIKEFAQLDGYGISKMVIDEIQAMLYVYFKIEPPPEIKENPKNNAQ